MPHTVAKKQQT